jgi:hypothetical protein
MMGTESRFCHFTATVPLPDEHVLCLGWDVLPASERNKLMELYDCMSTLDPEVAVKTIHDAGLTVR